MSRPDSRRPGDPARIVVRGVNWLGDAVMTTPALLRLRARFPAAEITLLTPAKLRDLWPGHPAVNRTLVMPAGAGVFSVARLVRAERFDLAVLFPNSPRSGLEALLAGIPRRVGGAWPGRNWLLTDVVPAPAGLLKMRKRTPDEVRRLVGPVAAGGDRRPAAGGAPPPVSIPRPPTSDHQLPATNFRSLSSASHQMFHYLRLVGYLGADPAALPPQLAVMPGEMEAVRAKFGFQPGTQWLGLNTGAEYGPAKRWPRERFAAVAAAIHREFGCGIAVFGGLADVGTAEVIAAELATAAPTVRILAGKTSLRELLAALTFCRVLLTNDTGPMHVAAAVGVPVVVPFGSTSPELTGPGLPGDPRHQFLRSDVPCAPCFLRKCPIDFRCLNGISVARVLEAVRRAWS